MNKVEVIENFFTADECSQATSKFFELKDHWSTSKHAKGKHVDHMTWQLGVSSSGLDSELGVWWRLQRAGKFNREEHLATYDSIIQQRIKEMNPLMLENFSWMYEILRTRLSHHLQKECRYLPDRATLPGFQTDSNIEGYFAGRGWHYDDQKQCHGRYFFDTEPGTQYSITIGINTPSYACFEYYDGDVCDYIEPWNGATFACESHIGLRGRPYECSAHPDCSLSNGKYGSLVSTPLNTGTLVLQTGRFFHRAGEGWHRTKEEMRLTVQAHATTFNDIVYIYW
jgi:hypothetical protein